MHFKDKIIWITGASSGIGKELALQLASQNAKLILTSSNKEKLQAVADECVRKGASAHCLTADLTHPNIIPELTKNAISIYKQIDLVIFSAGKSQRSSAEETDMLVQRQLMELNYFAPIAITRELLPFFRQQGHGHIVVISSMAGLMGFPLRTGYAASKHALKGYFETLQTEHTIPNFHITLAYPGRINTPISMHALKADGKAHGSMDEGQLRGIPVEKCAEIILKATAKKRSKIIIARGERLLWWIWWYFPKLYARIARSKGLK